MFAIAAPVAAEWSAVDAPPVDDVALALAAERAPAGFKLLGIVERSVGALFDLRHRSRATLLFRLPLTAEASLRCLAHEGAAGLASFLCHGFNFSLRMAAAI
jgi:hypothetical protein